MADMHTLPSPASSPSFKTTDLPPQPSRKRQRSRSMQSDTSSSSAKRTVSDGSPLDGIVHSPRDDQLSSLSLTDYTQDIDAYMAEQGEAEIPAVISFELSPVDCSVTFSSMPPQEKTSFVEKGMSGKMVVGETWYLVSRDWWKRWQKACTGSIDKEGGVTEGQLGPVNNSGLLDAFGNLHSSLAEGVDVEYVPEDVWKSFVSWYGIPIHPLPRRIIARGAAKLPSLELHPPRLKVFKLTKQDCTVNSDSASHPWLVLSAGDTISTLCTKLAESVSASALSHTPYRIWKLESEYDDWSNLEYPSSQLFAAGGKIVESTARTLEEDGIQSDDAFAVEFKQPEGWIVETPKPVEKSVNLEPAPIFNSKDGFFNKMGSSSTYTPPKTNGGIISAFNGSSSSSKISAFSLTTNNRNTKTLEPGTLGLGNMGNTCFMNSALQCLAHTKELTEYFLTGVHQEELNPDNPLGMHGAIAEAFGALLERIWASTGASTSYSPREFKSQLQRFAPQFSGYQQHDSQELVAFLLDGLHEDLNRVLKKPYVEKPDWEGGGDLELVQLAQKSWDGYMQRNDSVIVDLFQGQYQSTLVCPECQKVSITFDPFMYLTLPLPVQKKWNHAVYYIPWDVEKPHVKVPVEVNRDASFKDLRNLLGRWMGAPPENLLTMEIFNNRFYKSLDDNLLCGEMSDNDTIVCFELPCNAQQSRSYQKNPDDPFIIPTFLCDAKPPVRSSYLTSRAPTLFGYPTVIVLTHDQATDLNAIYDAVVGRLQRWTDNARDLYTWEVGGSSIDGVPIRIDAYPLADSLTEFPENGDVVTHETPIIEEGDIVDERSMMVDDDPLENSLTSGAPQIIGPKRDIFELKLQTNHKNLGINFNGYSTSNRWESWDVRMEEAVDEPMLLREGDAFFCEFDENFKAYFFGDETSRWEHARWNDWQDFIHPEYQEGKRSAAEKKHKGLSLQDCLDEFTKEEKLGEDDLWYCPRCKKHQQATKRFDLWKVPDVLVVHLKRFSNSRTLRDKIDTFIDFPLEGLDLGGMVGERAVAQRMLNDGVDIDNLNLGTLDEPLVYDLFGVDEHMGGLGGGHYRAYASNHLTGKWYHFDDSYVTTARPQDAVNSNAYLLFYRRRSSSPLGGKTYEKIVEARQRVKSEPNHLIPEPPMVTDHQLPTPPNEGDSFLAVEGLKNFPSRIHQWNLRTSHSNGGSSIPSPPVDEPPDFEESQSDLFISDDPLSTSNQQYDFPDPSSNKPSPSSSNEAEPDLDDWESNKGYTIGLEEVLPGDSPRWGPGSTVGSPSSSLSDANPFSDSNAQKGQTETMKPLHDSST